MNGHPLAGVSRRTDQPGQGSLRLTAGLPATGALALRATGPRTVWWTWADRRSCRE